jgi:hypothetical protein
MSEIDQYKHQCLGLVTCPSTYEIVYRNNSHRLIPIYRIDETAEEWHAKPGDLLLGGGSGESAALRISIPEALQFYTDAVRNEFDSLDELFHAYWNPNQAFVFCEGYAKLGWHPNYPINVWLTEHILAFLLREYPEVYRKYSGPDLLEQDGSICRLPTPGSDEETL